MRCCSLSRKIKIVHSRPSFPFFREKRPTPPSKESTPFFSLWAKKKNLSLSPSFLPSFHSPLASSCSVVRRCSFHLSEVSVCSLSVLLLLLLARKSPPWRRLLRTRTTVKKEQTLRVIAGKFKWKSEDDQWRCPYVTARCAEDSREERLAFNLFTRRTIFHARQKRWICGLFSPRRTLLDIDVRSAGVLFMLL